jgi:hypothetical protein
MKTLLFSFFVAIFALGCKPSATLHDAPPEPLAEGWQRIVSSDGAVSLDLPGEWEVISLSGDLNSAVTALRSTNPKVDEAELRKQLKELVDSGTVKLFARIKGSTASHYTFLNVVQQQGASGAVEDLAAGLASGAQSNVDSGKTSVDKIPVPIGSAGRFSVSGHPKGASAEAPQMTIVGYVLAHNMLGTVLTFTTSGGDQTRSDEFDKIVRTVRLRL